MFDLVQYPAVGFHFMVSFPDYKAEVRFQEVSGISREMNTTSLKEGGENRFEHTLPVRGKYSNLVLKRGYIPLETGLRKWIVDAIVNYDFTTTDISVVLLNEMHLPVGKWDFIKAWPVKWNISDLKAQDNSLVVETLELNYQYFESKM